MDELKTLKDLEQHQGDNWASDFYTVGIDDLKQMGIDRVKKLQKEFDGIQDYISNTNVNEIQGRWIDHFRGHFLDLMLCFEKMEVIMDIFNLTDEDLKETKQ